MMALSADLSRFDSCTAHTPTASTEKDTHNMMTILIYLGYTALAIFTLLVALATLIGWARYRKPCACRTLAHNNPNCHLNRKDND